MAQNEVLSSIRSYLKSVIEKSTAQNQSNRLESENAKLQPNSINVEYATATLQKDAAMNKSMELIELNYDCLEHIFNGFSLTDLINIGGTCRYLQSTAQTYFRTKYRKHNVYIDCDRYPNYTITSRQATYQRTDNGNNIEAFLFVFGAVLSKLTVHHMSPISIYVEPKRLEQDTKIQHLIETYCRKSLHEIRFQRCGKRTMNHVSPFEEVTKVSFDRCVLGEKVANFTVLFPKMRKLDLIDCDVRNVRNSIEKEFPQLEHFNLSVPLGANSWSESSFTIANVKAAIEYNPNLKSLNLCYWNESAYDAQLLKYAAAKLHQLKSLQLWHLRFTDFWSDGDIHFPTVQKLTLGNYNHQMGFLDRNLAALSFEKLRRFSIIGQFDTECTTFIARHKTIEELSIIPNGIHQFYPCDEDVFRIVSVLPKLEKIMVVGKCLTANGIIRLITKHNNLLMVIIHHYTFSVIIRKLFQSRCEQLGWNTASCAGNYPEIIIKRQLK